MLVGKELGPYLIDKELGSGAMGTVFRAKHKTSGARVAIKLMSLALGSSDAALGRFTREIAIIRQLDHPNVVKYINSGKYHGSPFIIMEYIDGESLDHIFHRKKRLSWEEVVEVGIHLCAGLQHAHDKGIIHRDLKPSNLMILKDGTVKLTDFGIAKDTDVTALTAANSTVGTAAYMSPEQCRGVRDITAKTDLYSMGIMFYELLTGRKPFIGETAMEVFLQHANKTDYRRPQDFVMDIPIWLDTLIVQLMEKEPAKRPLSAKAVAEALQLIKDKVAAQRSAGVEAVTKRRIDKSAGDKKIDKEDTEIARAIAGKKKKKAPPIYTRGWFTILALSMIALCLSMCLYFVFVKAPDPERLYEQARTMMASNDLSELKAAREGPLADFLRYHPKHDKVTQIQQWADLADFKIRERQMHNTRNRKIDPTATDARETELARRALDDEESGRLADAANLWEQLSKKKEHPNADIHIWALVGEHYLQDLKKVEDDYHQLAIKLIANSKPGNELERIALDARREELARDRELAKKDDTQAKERADEHLKKARRKWEELERDAKTPSPRGWYLLALKRKHDLR